MLQRWSARVQASQCQLPNSSSSRQINNNDEGEQGTSLDTLLGSSNNNPRSMDNGLAELEDELNFQLFSLDRPLLAARSSNPKIKKRHNSNQENVTSNKSRPPLQNNRSDYCTDKNNNTEEDVSISEKSNDKQRDEQETKDTKEMPSQETETKQVDDAADSGFIGVQRRKNKIKRFFLSGIDSSVKENTILSYLSRRGITPTYLKVFNSNRKETLSAKFHVHDKDVILVLDGGFWPEGVKCREWLTRNQMERLYNKY